MSRHEPTVQASLTIALVTLPLAVFSTADAHLTNACTGPLALGITEVSPTNDPTKTFYVDDRDYVLGNGTWIYEETNGVFEGGQPLKDLQRGGSSIVVPGDYDICVTSQTPDQLIF